MSQPQLKEVFQAFFIHRAFRLSGNSITLLCVLSTMLSVALSASSPTTVGPG